MKKRKSGKWSGIFIGCCLVGDRVASSKLSKKPCQVKPNTRIIHETQCNNNQIEVKMTQLHGKGHMQAKDKVQKLQNANN
ncbi:hypothetical protein Leryth_016431 [Lithospermum erythrorhizon]|nr:hypothetical protein Leryth_016431 [Lithospermum erythrorhizon]